MPNRGLSMNPFDTSNKTMFSPLWESVAPRFVRRGHFWVTGERIKRGGLSYQAGPMYVAWEAPAEVTRPYPKGGSPTSTGVRHSRERSWHDLRKQF